MLESSLPNGQLRHLGRDGLTSGAELARAVPARVAAELRGTPTLLNELAVALGPLPLAWAGRARPLGSHLGLGRGKLADETSLSRFKGEQGDLASSLGAHSRPRAWRGGFAIEHARAPSARLATGIAQ